MTINTVTTDGSATADMVTIADDTTMIIVIVIANAARKSNEDRNMRMALDILNDNHVEVTSWFVVMLCSCRFFGTYRWLSHERLARLVQLSAFYDRSGTRRTRERTTKAATTWCDVITVIVTIDDRIAHCDRWTAWSSMSRSTIELLIVIDGRHRHDWRSSCPSLLMDSLIIDVTMTSINHNGQLDRRSWHRWSSCPSITMGISIVDRDVQWGTQSSIVTRRRNNMILT